MRNAVNQRYVEAAENVTAGRVETGSAETGSAETGSAEGGVICCWSWWSRVLQ